MGDVYGKSCWKKYVEETCEQLRKLFSGPAKFNHTWIIINQHRFYFFLEPIQQSVPLNCQHLHTHLWELQSLVRLFSVKSGRIRSGKKVSHVQLLSNNPTACVGNCQWVIVDRQHAPHYVWFTDAPRCLIEDKHLKHDVPPSVRVARLTSGLQAEPTVARSSPLLSISSTSLLSSLRFPFQAKNKFHIYPA